MRQDENFKKWADEFEVEKDRIRREWEEQNKIIKEDKIKFMALQNVGHPPSDGWE